MVPGHRLGIVGTALLFMAVAAIISRIFVQRHRRGYASTEYWKMIGYCTIWAVLLEMFVLYTVVVMPQLAAGHVEAGPLMFAVPFAIIMDFVLIWLSFRHSGRRVIASYLAKHGIDPNEASEPTPTAVTPSATHPSRQP